MRGAAVDDVDDRHALQQTVPVDPTTWKPGDAKQVAVLWSSRCFD